MDVDQAVRLAQQIVRDPDATDGDQLRYSGREIALAHAVVEFAARAGAALAGVCEEER